MAELQRVERELQEKAHAQMMLNNDDNTGQIRATEMLEVIFLKFNSRLISKKGHNLLFYFRFREKFRKCIILLPAFNLIMWLMKLPKNFEKIAILKIGELKYGSEEMGS